MNTKRWFCLLFAAALLAGRSPLAADGDVCSSSNFQAVFLEGQRGVIIDYTSPSPELIAMGNRILPCLIRIAEHGGDELIINECIEGKYGCEGWALTAIRMIGTVEARKYLIDNLDSKKERYLLRIAIREVGILRDTDAREELRDLLQHPDPVIRVESLVSLAGIGNRSDFDLLLATALGLPDEHLRAATNGLRILGDARAVEPLSKRLAAVESTETRRDVEYILDDWKAQIGKDQSVLATLRTASGQDLYDAIHGVERVSEDLQTMLEKLLEHEDPRARAESVRTLAMRRRSPDVDRLLEVTTALPPEYVLIAVQGLEILNDPRTIQPLEDYAGGMTTGRRRRELSAIIERIRRRAPVESRTPPT